MRTNKRGGDRLGRRQEEGGADGDHEDQVCRETQSWKTRRGHTHTDRASRAAGFKGYWIRNKNRSDPRSAPLFANHQKTSEEKVFFLSHLWRT